MHVLRHVTHRYCLDPSPSIHDLYNTMAQKVGPVNTHSSKSISWMMMIAIVITVTIKCDANDQCMNTEKVFLEEPLPLELYHYVPINTNVTYNCSVNNTNVRWSITPDGQDLPSSTSDNIAVTFLQDRGIFAESVTNSGSTRSSRLTVLASEENNVTTISCVTQFSSLVCESSIITLFVYGPPTQPTELMLEPVDVTIQLVTISWTISTPNVPGSNLTSTLIITNLNGSNSSPIVYKELTEFHYIFNASVQESFSPCDHYHFNVTAMNGAGASSPEDIILTLPSLPNITSVSDSLTHVVEKNEVGRIVIKVSFKPAGFCEDYAVMNYSVVLNSSMGTEIKTYPVISSRGERLLNATFGPSYDVQENTMYLHSVTAMNSEGNVTSISKECFTSDLKKLNLTRNGNRTLCVQCTFINGSDALGCKIVLVSNNSLVGNVSRTFYRSSSELILQGEVNVSEDFSCYHRVFGFDVESDNTTSDLAIPGNLNITSNSACSPQMKGHIQQYVIVIVVVSVTVVITLLVLITISVVIFFIIQCKRNNRKDYEFENSTNQAYGVALQVDTNFTTVAVTEEHIYDTYKCNDIEVN